MAQTPIDPGHDASAEGARARAAGRPKDACPYPPDSRARRTWLEGYDGLPDGGATDLPPDVPPALPPEQG